MKIKHQFGDKVCFSIWIPLSFHFLSYDSRDNKENKEECLLTAKWKCSSESHRHPWGGGGGVEQKTPQKTKNATTAKKKKQTQPTHNKNPHPPLNSEDQNPKALKNVHYSYTVTSNILISRKSKKSNSSNFYINNHNITKLNLSYCNWSIPWNKLTKMVPSELSSRTITYMWD